MDGRGWGVGDWLTLVAGLVYESGKIMIGSIDNSGGAVVGARVWNRM